MALTSVGAICLTRGGATDARRCHLDDAGAAWMLVRYVVAVVQRCDLDDAGAIPMCAGTITLTCARLIARHADEPSHPPR